VKNSERLAWLRLVRTENIGPVTFANLIALRQRGSRAGSGADVGGARGQA
jgi:hypothetical protein